MQFQVGDGTIRYECGDRVDAKGHYTLGINGDKTGAPPGEYKVWIDTDPYNEPKYSNCSKVAEKYRSASSTPLKVEVKEGENKIDLVLK
jgi:hypothetical protein